MLQAVEVQHQGQLRASPGRRALLPGSAFPFEAWGPLSALPFFKGTDFARGAEIFECWSLGAACGQRGRLSPTPLPRGTHRSQHPQLHREHPHGYHEGRASPGTPSIVPSPGCPQRIPRSPEAAGGAFGAAAKGRARAGRAGLCPAQQRLRTGRAASRGSGVWIEAGARLGEQEKICQWINRTSLGRLLVCGAPPPPSRLAGSPVPLRAPSSSHHGHHPRPTMGINPVPPWALSSSHHGHCSRPAEGVSIPPRAPSPSHHLHHPIVGIISPATAPSPSHHGHHPCPTVVPVPIPPRSPSLSHHVPFSTQDLLPFPLFPATSPAPGATPGPSRGLGATVPPPSPLSQAFPLPSLPRKQPTVLVVCGPAQNGAIGLVCARHLRIFVGIFLRSSSSSPSTRGPQRCLSATQDYEPTIFYPKRSPDPLYRDFTTQCEKMDIPFLSYLPTEVSPGRSWPPPGCLTCLT